MSLAYDMGCDLDDVSVPIRGLLNLTGEKYKKLSFTDDKGVSVPIRGLLNLTICDECNKKSHAYMFPSPLGDY